MSFHNKLIFIELCGSLPRSICHIHTRQFHQVHHGPFTAAVMMLISQIDGSSELAPSDLKGSTTGRQSSSVMLKHYCVGVVQAGKPFGCSEFPDSV